VIVPFRVRDALEWTGARLLRGDLETEIHGVSIDTRTLKQGELFVAIAGPHHDGHDHLLRALEAGASGVVVAGDRPLPMQLDAELPALAVDDTPQALARLAAGHRRGFQGPVVAITGSNGKTTTKEMCAAILEVGAPTLKNRGNLNNQFGLPLTLLGRTREQQRVVVELGMNHRGEIAALAEIARPGVGLVTNIGTAHIEHLGSRDEIAREKGDLLAALPADGAAVVNAEDDYREALAARTQAPVLSFGRAPGADVTAEDAQLRDDAGFAFRLRSPQGAVAARVAGLGETTLVNALGAAAAALAAGARLDEVAEGLARYRPVAGRLERRELPGGVVLVDDSYNANPQSMEVALRLLARSGSSGRRVAVLGDMGELGEASGAAHREAGRLAASLGINFLVAVGQQAEQVAEGATAAGMSSSRIRVARSSVEAGPPVREILKGGDWVLVKGSRAMQMERVAEFLEAEGGS
jgi:UDP-N-acetylmuramoyl-tripeptide--D-alanyl-D-alanine ligase